MAIQSGSQIKVILVITALALMFVGCSGGEDTDTNTESAGVGYYDTTPQEDLFVPKVVDESTIPNYQAAVDSVTQGVTGADKVVYDVSEEDTDIGLAEEGEAPLEFDETNTEEYTTVINNVDTLEYSYPEVQNMEGLVEAFSTAPNDEAYVQSAINKLLSDEEVNASDFSVSDVVDNGNDVTFKLVSEEKTYDCCYKFNDLALYVR